MSKEGVDHSRRRFLTVAATVVGGAGVVAVAVPFVSSMNPSARAQAAGAPVEVDIGKLDRGPEGGDGVCDPGRVVDITPDVDRDLGLGDRVAPTFTGHHGPGGMIGGVGEEADERPRELESVEPNRRPEPQLPPDRSLAGGETP